MNYQEELKTATPYKLAYLKGIDTVIERRQKEAATARAAYAAEIFDRPEDYRKDLCATLGWPLTDPRPAEPPKVTEELMSEEDGYTIYRVQIEVLEGLPLQGLLFKQNGAGKRPMVIAQHGGSGTPELLAGMFGSTHNYNDMLHRVLKQGVHVFAPSLMIWSVYSYDAPFDRNAIDAKLKRVGSSITALEVYGIMRVLDYYESTDYVSGFGMVGLSYGGFYTLYTTAVDTRIRSAISDSYFNERNRYPWPDWVWRNSAFRFDDAEIACLVYPRRLSIQIGDKDDLFDYRGGEASFARVKELAGSRGTDWIDLTVFDGTHEFYKEDWAIARLIRDLEVAK
ncbi:MAG: hypothetical protein J6D21_08650 [Clostridia bacterium]|nr:hypothetical protein [Clostridia bacterium]